MSMNGISTGAVDYIRLVEDFYTIQGEGAFTGMAAYFIRLAGCDVRCPWCDARFTWDLNAGATVSVAEVADRVRACGARTVVITGGEPFMHDLGALTGALHDVGVRIHVETSGTHPLTGNVDWVCLSPKRHKKPLADMLRRADELKVVIQTAGDFSWAEECAAGTDGKCRLFLQPEWGVSADMTAVIVEYVKRNPQWRISLQTHKFMNIP